MMAVIPYEATGCELDVPAVIDIVPASGMTMVDVIGPTGKSLLPSEYSVDEDYGRLTITAGLVRGDIVRALFKTLPRTGSGIIGGTSGIILMVDHEEADYESSDYE